MSLPVISEGNENEAPLTSSQQRFKEQAAEMGRKGGKRVTERKLVQLSLARRKWCGADCPIFPCAWAPLSKQKYEGRCAVKEQPPEVQQSAVNLYMNGLAGLQAQAVDLLAQLTKELQEKGEQLTASQRRALLRDIALVKDTFYGKKLTLDGTIKNENTLTIDVLREAIITSVQKEVTHSSAAENGPQLSDEPAATPTGDREDPQQGDPGQPANAEEEQAMRGDGSKTGGALHRES